MEVELYSQSFGIPKERIKVALWCMNMPEVEPAEPLHRGRYACAIGGNGRDYETLLLAAQQNPDIPMVWVVRRENVEGMSIPPHITVVYDVPYGESMNCLQYSQFMALPLKGAEVPCGHVTIVSAMLLRKAIVATDSAGISDYVTEGENGLLCRANDPDHLAARMRLLWGNEAWSKDLGEQGFAFAEKNCSESKVGKEMTIFLRERGLVAEKRVEPDQETLLYIPVLP